MFTASVGTVGPMAKGFEREKTVFRSKSAFKTHCTARKLTKKVATFALANLAIKTRPTEMNKPAKSVNGIPDHALIEKIGLKNPKIIVKAKIRIPQDSRTIRAATAFRINSSNNAPKTIEPR